MGTARHGVLGGFFMLRGGMGMQAQQAEPTKKLLLTVNEAAQMLSLSRPFFYRLMQRGEIASLKLGGSRRIQLTELQAFVARQVSTQKGY